MLTLYIACQVIMGIICALLAEKLTQPYGDKFTQVFWTDL